MTEERKRGLRQVMPVFATWYESVLRFVTQHFGAGLVIGILGVTASIATYVTDQVLKEKEARIVALEGQLDAERQSFLQHASQMETQLKELLPTETILLSPENGSALVMDSVTLRWKNRIHKQTSDYLVQVRKIAEIDRNFPPSWNDDDAFLATTPHDQSTRYPAEREQPLKLGTYLWRVAPGTIREGAKQYQGHWSGYYMFRVFQGHMEKIKELHVLQVGVHYSHESEFMSRNLKGEPSGKDYELIKRIAIALGKDPDTSGNITAVPFPYPTVDSLLYDGLKRGEVDVGIGEITRTNARKSRGIRFTRSYLEFPLVLLAAESRPHLKPGDRVGVLKGTTYAKAARFLLEKRKKGFKQEEADSLQPLIDQLDNGTIDSIILDKPIAELWEKKGYKIVETLSDDLEDYYKSEGRDAYAIAVRDETLCRKITKIMTEDRDVVSFIRKNYGPQKESDDTSCQLK